jgi:hypothetical protein
MNVLTCKLPSALNGRLTQFFTLDSDFRVYRRNKRQSLPLICP